ncbi:UBX domain-containing protein 11-like isoform X1 [Apis dorsata]|uniref:UBX domain-containing protein 11-like isoform X1 n=1 Tax=Apis dorsata TaxID=7462 RepID=UPI0012930FCB|nr:UBX domain-containing protein 11-like isoform X1 [Apis dorsata]
MQKAQSDLKRSEEQIRLKDQEIYKMKRKVRHIYFILSRLSSRFSSSTAIEISNSLQIKDWEIKNKNQESLRKKEQQQQRVQADQSEYLYRRCLMLEQRIFEMEKFLADYGLIWVGNSTNSPKYPETILK